MPFDTAILDGDFVPMNHKTVQPIGAQALKVYDEHGREIAGFHHIVNCQTGETIRVAPASYTVVQNDHAIEAMEKALTASQLDLTDGRFGVDYSHDGARMYAQWLLPAHTAKVRPGVEATLRAILLNAYDGTSALSGRIGSFNWACANQAVSGKEYGSFRFVHTGEIDIVPAVKKLAKAAEEHVAQVSRWERWPGVPVSDQQVRAVMSSLPKLSEAQIDSLIHGWLKARDEDPLQGGPNLWCLYNVMTAWATERGGGANRAFRNWGRQNDVAQVVDGKLWAEIEAHA